MSDWQDMNTAPKNGTRILLAIEHLDQGFRYVNTAWWDRDLECWIGGHLTSHRRPIAWQLCPEPPEPHT